MARPSARSSQPASQPASTSPTAAGSSAVRSEHVLCPVCDRDAARPYRANMYRLAGIPFHLVRCACGMVYVDPRPDGASLSRMYDNPDYYTHGYNLGVEDENYFDRKDELIAQYEATARDLAREIGGAGDLLELGSAGGFFLEGARRAGFRVKGVELSAQAADYSRDELGLEVFRGELASAPFPKGSFNVAYADNVLEHTTAPGKVLETLSALLRPGGHLVVVVPSYVNSPYFRLLLAAQSVVPRRLLGKKLLRMLKMDPDFDGGHPYHILEFDRRALTALVSRSGFEVVGVEGSVPLPAHLFKVASPNFKTLALRAIFRSFDALMRAGVLPGARLRLLARRR